MYGLPFKAPCVHVRLLPMVPRQVGRGARRRCAEGMAVRLQRVCVVQEEAVVGAQGARRDV